MTTNLRTRPPKSRLAKMTRGELVAAERKAKREAREMRRGEAMAMMASDPAIKIAEVARRTGMSVATINGIRAQMSREFVAPMQELRKVTQGRLQALTDDRLDRVLEAVDDNAIRGAGLRDKAYAADRLFNMRQLMRGEPTSILSVDDRRTLNNLLPALLAEAQRRGVTLEGEHSVVFDDGPASRAPDSQKDIIPTRNEP